MEKSGFFNRQRNIKIRLSEQDITHVDIVSNDHLLDWKQERTSAIILTCWRP